MTERHPHRSRGGLSLIGLLALVVAAVAGLVVPRTASASCVLSATYLGVSYGGGGTLAGADVGAPAGPGTLPGCNDVITIPPRPPEPSTRVTLRRVTGVAPRFAVALRQGDPVLLMPFTSPCIRSTTLDAQLACLRARTRRYLTGPSLIAPPSARAGEVIGLAVRVADPARRGRPSFGLDALLQRKSDDGSWRSLFHLTSAIGGGDPPAPVAVGDPGFAVPAIAVIGGTPQRVRLPGVEPGAYRLAKRISLGSTSRWVVSDLTILAP